MIFIPLTQDTPSSYLNEHVCRLTSSHLRFRCFAVKKSRFWTDFKKKKMMLQKISTNSTLPDYSLSNCYSFNISASYDRYKAFECI